MSFAVPNLASLIQRIAGDIEAQLPGTDALLRRNLLAILGRTLAGAAHGLYGHQDWIADQVFPDTAVGANLARWATIWGVTRKSAAAASGTLACTGTNGTLIPTGTQWTRSDGAAFASTADATIGAGSATVTVAASVAGEDGDTDAGITLTLVSALAGVNSTAMVGADGLEGGADTESDPELLARLLARIQQPPGGGTLADYVRWTLAVPGVTRAWAFPYEISPNSVTVRMVDDDADPIIPPQATVDAVRAQIDALRPVTAQVYAYAPTAAPLDCTIQLVPNTADVQAAVAAELADLLLREGAPGATILLSHINEAIAIAAGETDHVLVAPSADVIYTTAQMPVMGTITWQ